MPSPSVEQMWQEIRMLKTRICELEDQVAKFPPPEEVVADGWIDWDEVYVMDKDGAVVLYQ